MTTQPHEHSHPVSELHPHADPEGELSPVVRIQRLAMFLEAHFGEVELHMPDESTDEPEQGEDDREPSLLVRLDDVDARINLHTLVCPLTLSVDCYLVDRLNICRLSQARVRL